MRDAAAERGETLPPLAALGERIPILGPSNSGKSTLAQVIARTIASEAVHLDQLRHLPGTNWVERPDEEFRTCTTGRSAGIAGSWTGTTLPCCRNG